jgi:hypothetical protein
LGHLRNRDVDLTYLSLTVWWSFLVVAVAPFTALTVRHLVSPGARVSLPKDLIVVIDPHGPVGPDSRLQPVAVRDLIPYVVDTPMAIGVAVTLTLLVFLTRNAILRVRESYADTAAAPSPAAKEDLTSVIGRLAARGRRRGIALFRKHPTPARRLAVVERPELLLRPQLGELVGAGVVAGVLSSTAKSVVNDLYLLTTETFDHTRGITIVGGTIGALLAGLMCASLWRWAAARTADRPMGWTWLLVPVGVVLGFLVGDSLPLFTDRSPQPRVEIEVQGFAWLIQAGPYLLAGAVALAAWFMSSGRRLRALQATHTAMVATVAAAMIAASGWFAIWYVKRFHDSWLLHPGDIPVSGGSIGWFRELGRWAGVRFAPMESLENSPYAFLGLTLLWVVPVVTVVRHRSWVDIRHLRTVLRTAAIAGLAVLVAAITLPFAARAALPEPVRADPGDELEIVFTNTYIALAAIAQAVAASIVAASARRFRPTLALLATAVTAVIATLGELGAFTAASCADLFANGATCAAPPVHTDLLASYLLRIAVPGVVVAAPAAVAGGLLFRHRRTATASRPAAAPSIHPYAVAVAMLAAVTLIAVPQAVAPTDAAAAHVAPSPDHVCATADGTNTNRLYRISERIIDPSFCARALAGERWVEATPSWFTAAGAKGAVYPAGYRPERPDPIDDFNAKFAGVRFVQDPGTAAERTFAFGREALRTGFVRSDGRPFSTVVSGVFPPLSVGRHSTAVYLTMTADHCDGLGTDRHHNCLPKGTFLYTVAWFTFSLRGAD